MDRVNFKKLPGGLLTVIPLHKHQEATATMLAVSYHKNSMSKVWGGKEDENTYP